MDRTETNDLGVYCLTLNYIFWSLLMHNQISDFCFLESFPQVTQNGLGIAPLVYVQMCLGDGCAVFHT